MKQLTIRFAITALFVSSVLGCKGSDPSQQDDKALRAGLSGQNFDPSKMPPQARAIVEGMKKSGGTAANKH